MLLFQRLKKTLSSGIHTLLEDIENHEAVVDATIQEVEGHAAAVRAHRTACEARIELLEKRARELDAEAGLWRGRARALQHERERALDCVRRLRVASEARANALVELEKQRALCEAVSADERAIAEKLDELRRRSARLRSRQARTAAEEMAPEPVAVDDVLRRWEARVAKSEALWRTARESDASALTQNEEAALVSAELNRLLAEEDDR